MVKFINIYVSYSSEDRQMWKELEKYLIPFKRMGLITIWDSSAYGLGTEREREIEAHLEASHLILLLISPDYLADDYLYEIEMRRAMERHSHEEARVLPILLHPVHWQEEPFGRLPILPENLRPVSLWRKKRVAFLQISMRIRDAIEQISR